MPEDIKLRSAHDWEEVRRAAVGAGRTFENRTPEEPFFFERTVHAPTLPLENTVLLLVDDEIVSQLQVYERQLHLDDVRARIGAIGNVYTLPKYQGEGFGARLLEYTCEYLADRGYALSVLRTGSPAFYRKSGWESVPYDRHRVKDPEPVDVGDGNTFERFQPVDLDRLMALYRASRGTETGSIHRPRILWTDWIFDPAMKILSSPEQIQLYCPDGDAEGYLVWDEVDGDVVCLEVGYAGTDRASFWLACREFLIKRASGAIEWHPPVADLLAEWTGDFTSETRVGDMVQVHSSDEITRLTCGTVEDTTDLVEYLTRDGFYWSNVDRF